MASDTENNPNTHVDSVQTEQAPRRRSVWTTKQKVIRTLWGTLGRMLWIACPSARSSTLRFFGGKVGKHCVFARNVDIAIPWNITMGDDVFVGDDSILYSLGMITIGDGCVLDTKAHLCAGTHDMSDPLFPLTRPPITLGTGCFVGFDAYIGPEVILGDRTKVHPRSSVYRSTDADTVWRGNPAKLVEPDIELDIEQAQGQEGAA